MMGEGSERSRKRPEGQDEDEQPEVDEKPQTAKEVLDELRPEIENKPSEPEETEPPQQEPFWYPETAEPCVRDATKELAWKEDMEREREEEKERERERARQEREENVERENFDDLEKELQRALEDRGIDPEDLKERWRKQFVKDIEDYLKEKPEEKEQDSDEKDIEGTSGQKSDVERASQHDAGSGQMYELETKPSVESDTEAETEPQSEPVADTQEPESSPESELPKERVQPSLEKSEPSSEPDAVPREHERSSSKENVEEPEIESVPTEKPSNKTKSVEDTVIQEKAKPRTEQTTVDIPQETSKSEKEIESNETKEEAITETSEIEAETESQEPESVDESEDLVWQEQLMQIYNETPEEWREVFREYLRGLVEDEEDLRRLLEKHGLEYILEDEEQMDEVRKFLELKEALREQGKENLESIAEELEIDMEQAERWASGEVESQILIDVLNLEAYWTFWELLRLNAERDFPESVEDLEEILQNNPMLELADPTLPFELWKKDAKAWVELMGMKKRGEIRTRLRNGREIYHREDIERLSAKFSLPKAEIIAWLRGEKVPPLLRKIGKKGLKKKKQISETEQHLMKIQKTLDGMSELSDVERCTSATYLNEIMKNSKSHQIDISRTVKFFQFVKELKNSSNLVTATRRAGLKDNQSKDWVYRGKLPFLVRTALSVPTTKPTIGRKWLPMKVTMGRTFKQYIQVPTKIRSIDQIKQVLRQLEHLDEQLLRSLEEELGLKQRLQVDETFMYFLGLLVSDGAFNQKDGISTRVNLSLSKGYSWSKQVGLAFQYSLALMGIRSKQQKSTESMNEDGSKSVMLKWQSESSPLFIWIRNVVLGLNTSKTKSDTTLDIDWVLSFPPHLQIAFLQGIADGDGWTSIRTLESGISTTTNQTLIDKIMTNLGIESKIYGNDVRISKKKALEKALKLPLFKNATGRLRRLEEICKILRMMSPNKRRRIIGTERKIILQLAKKGLSSGEICSILWAEHSIARRPKSIQRFVRRNSTISNKTPNIPERMKD